MHFLTSGQRPGEFLFDKTCFQAYPQSTNESGLHQTKCHVIGKSDIFKMTPCCAAIDVFMDIPLWSHFDSADQFKPEFVRCQ